MLPQRNSFFPNSIFLRSLKLNTNFAFEVIKGVSMHLWIMQVLGTNVMFRKAISIHKIQNVPKVLW